MLEKKEAGYILKKITDYLIEYNVMTEIDDLYKNETISFLEAIHELLAKFTE